ncbi:MAG: DUF456 domain-containing protein, partial [Candidatus Eremiobacteraeota bacterium]|nr:DUF456 domain-containing protein [Candidatus Eremiobacteraeota bacterium]
MVVNPGYNVYASPTLPYANNSCCGGGPQVDCCQQGLGAPVGRAGMWAGIGGLIGAVLGQMLIPIPGLGALLGGMIGALLGGMLGGGGFGGAEQHCCCHNMGQFGPGNQMMAPWMGFPPGYGPSPYYPPAFPDYGYGNHANDFDPWRQFHNMPETRYHHQLPDLEPHRHEAPRHERHVERQEAVGDRLRTTVEAGDLGQGATLKPEVEHHVESENDAAAHTITQVQTGDVGPQAEVAPQVETVVESDDGAATAAVETYTGTGDLAEEAVVAPHVE